MTTNRGLQWTLEYTFSLNLAWMIVWIERVKTPIMSGSVFSWVSALTARADQLVSPIGGHTVLDQLIWSYIIAAVIFIVLRQLSRFDLAILVLRGAVGLAAIAAFPIAALFFGVAHPTCCVGTYRVALALESLIALTCGITYCLARRRISGLLLIIVLVVHFSIWAWATTSYISIPAFVDALRSNEYYHPWTRTIGSLGFAIAFNFGFPVIGLLSGLTWVRYLKSQSELIGPD
jgi:hypothetical protein